MLLERSAGNRSLRKPRIWLGAYGSTSLAKPRPRALPRLLGLDLAVARRGVGLQRGQQAPRAVEHFGNRAVERLGVGLRRRIEAGEVSHELQRGSMDLGVRGRGIEIEQELDVTAHISLSSAPIVDQGRTASAKSDGVAYSVMNYPARSPCRHLQTASSR